MSGEGTLGVRTMLGDLERTLVAEVLRRLAVVGMDELQAPDGLLRLIAVEDVKRFLGGNPEEA